MYRAIALFICGAITAQSEAILITESGYVEDFDTLASSGSSSSLPSGWAISESTYSAGSGTSQSGGIYSFGSNASDRALGSLNSNATGLLRFGAEFLNGASGAISSLAISYQGEQWRKQNSSVDTLSFEYSLDASSLSTGTWIGVSGLDFDSPVTSGPNTSIDGNLAANSSSLDATIAGLAIAPGETFWIRFNDSNISGSDQAMAIDNFSVQVSAVPEPTAALFGSLIAGAMGVTVARRRRSED